MIKAGIIGSTGYAGQELVRILTQHKDAEVVWYGSRSYIDQKYYEVFRNMFQIVDDKCLDDNMDELASKVDVIFTATPQGLCSSLVSEEILSKVKIIDLSADFRIKDVNRYEEWYGIKHQSPEFIDFKAKKEDSDFANLFLRNQNFWPENRPTQADIDLIYKRKDKAPFQEVTFADGTTELVWNTFGEEQIDLDVNQAVTRRFIKETLEQLIDHGCDIVRLDAFAYAIKKLDTNDFFVEPEIWDLLNDVRDITIAKGCEILPEIHEHYSIQHKIADHNFYIYDFALPMVSLYTLYSGQTKQLAKW